MKTYKQILRILRWLPCCITVTGCTKFLDRKPLTATLSDLNQGACKLIV
jgi:hypothetical protein